MADRQLEAVRALQQALSWAHSGLEAYSANLLAVPDTKAGSSDTADHHSLYKLCQPVVENSTGPQDALWQHTTGATRTAHAAVGPAVDLQAAASLLHVAPEGQPDQASTSHALPDLLMQMLDHSMKDQVSSYDVASDLIQHIAERLGEVIQQQTSTCTLPSLPEAFAATQVQPPRGGQGEPDALAEAAAAVAALTAILGALSALSSTIVQHRGGDALGAASGSGSNRAGPNEPLSRGAPASPHATVAAAGNSRNHSHHNQHQEQHDTSSQAAALASGPELLVLEHHYRVHLQELQRAHEEEVEELVQRLHGHLVAARLDAKVAVLKCKAVCRTATAHVHSAVRLCKAILEVPPRVAAAPAIAGTQQGSAAVAAPSEAAALGGSGNVPNLWELQQVEQDIQELTAARDSAACNGSASSSSGGGSVAERLSSARSAVHSLQLQAMEQLRGWNSLQGAAAAEAARARAEALQARTSLEAQLEAVQAELRAEAYKVEQLEVALQDAQALIAAQAADHHAQLQHVYDHMSQQVMQQAAAVAAAVNPASFMRQVPGDCDVLMESPYTKLPRAGSWGVGSRSKTAAGAPVHGPVAAQALLQQQADQMRKEHETELEWRASMHRRELQRLASQVGSLEARNRELEATVDRLQGDISVCDQMLEWMALKPPQASPNHSPHMASPSLAAKCSTDAGAPAV